MEAHTAPKSSPVAVHTKHTCVNTAYTLLHRVDGKTKKSVFD